MSKKKQKHTELIAELHAQAVANNNSKIEVAQAIAQEVKAEVAQTAQTEKAVKVRDVKDYIKIHTPEEIEHAPRKIERDRKSYILHGDQAYFTTTFKNPETNKEEYLGMQLMRQLLAQHLETLRAFDTVKSGELVRKLQTTGSAFSAVVRNALNEISYITSAKQIEENIDEVVSHAIEAKKQLLRFDTSQNENLHRYTYLKL